MEQHPPDAELLIATGCHHCPVVLAALAELVKVGELSQLTVTNIAADPAAGAARGVRSVPWARIGPFELQGLHTRDELAGYARQAGSDEGRRAYLVEMLGTGQLAVATSACRRDPPLLDALLALAGDLETPFAVRVGAAAAVEALADDGLLADHEAALLALADDASPQVRADAAHFLGLAGTAAGRRRLAQLLDDPDAAVRDIARDALGDGA